MRIKEIKYQSRNDFKAIYVCEHCGYALEAWGYSDANFYCNVVPNVQCNKCGLNSSKENEEQTQKRLGRTYKFHV